MAMFGSSWNDDTEEEFATLSEIKYNIKRKEAERLIKDRLNWSGDDECEVTDSMIDDYLSERSDE